MLVGKTVIVQYRQWKGNTAPDGKWVDSGEPFEATIEAVGFSYGQWGLLLRRDGQLLTVTVHETCVVRIKD